MARDILVGDYANNATLWFDDTPMVEQRTIYMDFPVLDSDTIEVLHNCRVSFSFPSYLS